MKNQHKIHLMNQVFNVLSHKQVAPPIIKAYADQYTRARHQGLGPSIIKAYADQYTRARRQLRLLDRPGGCEHLKYDRFKMYIDQGVHFQIRINKSILLIHSISPSCKSKYFEMRAPRHSVSKSVLRHRDVRLSYGSYFETC